MDKYGIGHSLILDEVNEKIAFSDNATHTADIIRKMDEIVLSNTDEAREIKKFYQ